MDHPFSQKRKGSLLIREFSKDIDSKDLVWHRDKTDRYVKVSRGKGWQLQLENKLPIELSKGETYFIPALTYHRVVRGETSLVVEIFEDLKN